MEGAWEVLGKLAVVAGGVWAVIQIYGKLFVKKCRVSYSFESIDKVVPPLEPLLCKWFDERIADVVRHTIVGSLSKTGITRDNFLTAERIINESVLSLKTELVAAVNVDAKYYFLARVPPRLVRIRVANDGSRVAKNLVVDLGDAPVASRFSSEEMRSEGSALRLAELRPKQSVVADVWFEYWSGRGVAVSHDDHIVEPGFEARVKGFWAIIGTPPFNVMIPFAFVFVLFW